MAQLKNPARIVSLVFAVKQAVVNGYAAAITDGLVPDDLALPEFRKVVPGLPAYDCAGLFVHNESSFSHTGNIATQIVEPQLAQAGHALVGIVVGVHLVRCVPVQDDNGNPPTVDQDEDASTIIYTDEVLMYDSVVAAQRASVLPRCSGVAFQSWTSITPNGGVGGGILRVRLGVE